MFKVELFELSSLPQSFRGFIEVPDVSQALRIAQENHHTHCNVWTQKHELIYSR